jgi:hypothetical protein
MSDPNVIYAETLKNLKLTYTSNSNQERSQAEKNLVEMEKEIFKNFNMILRNLSLDQNVDGDIF